VQPKAPHKETTTKARTAMVTYALAGLIVAYALITSHSIRTFHNHLVEHTDRLNHRIEGLITMSTQDTINAVVAQLGKAKGEILTQIADLNTQIANAGVAEQVDTSALIAAGGTG